MIDQNLFVWMGMLDGLIVDIRTAPRYRQEAAFEKGNIPYILGESPHEDG